MAEVVNLRQARKAKARAEAKGIADENAARFGRTKALKKLEAARAEAERRALDGHERE